MARKKRPVALFEVMHKAKLVGSTMRGGGSPPAAAPPPQRGIQIRRAPAPAAEVMSPPDWDDQVALEKDLRIAPPRRVAGPPFSQRLRQAWDRTKSWFSLWAPAVWGRITRNSSAVMGFAALAAVIAGILIGQQIIRARHISASDSNDALSADEPNSSVMDVKTSPPPTPSPAEAGDADSSLPPGQPASDTEQPTDPPRRVNNLNYVLVQSYVEKSTADEACAFLKKNGIYCTVEKDLHGWRGFYSVLGLKGFARLYIPESHTPTPEYKSYINDIQALSKPFAGSHAQNLFHPMAVKWSRSD